SAVVFDSVDELEGLTRAQIAAAASEAQARGLDGKYVITLLNTTGPPPEAQLMRRESRERLHRASVARGSRGGPYDNRAILSEVLKLRAERAQLLGYANH